MFLFLVRLLQVNRDRLPYEHAMYFDFAANLLHKPKVCTACAGRRKVLAARMHRAAAPRTFVGGTLKASAPVPSTSSHMHGTGWRDASARRS